MPGNKASTKWLLAIIVIINIINSITIGNKDKDNDNNDVN